jgi:hypothetical protein
MRFCICRYSTRRQLILTCNRKSSEATIGMLHGLAVILMALPARYSILRHGEIYLNRSGRMTIWSSPLSPFQTLEAISPIGKS